MALYLQLHAHLTGQTVSSLENHKFLFQFSFRVYDYLGEKREVAFAFTYFIFLKNVKRDGQHGNVLFLDLILEFPGRWASSDTFLGVRWVTDLWGNTGGLRPSARIFLFL